MKPARIISLILGCLLLLPGLSLLIGGAGLAVFRASVSDPGGSVQVASTALRTPTAAVTAENLLLSTADVQSPKWLATALNADIRLRVASAGNAKPIFVGIGPAADVAGYLRGVAHDQVSRTSPAGAAEYTRTTGTATVGAPASQKFWATSATGTGVQELSWKLNDGTWTIVVMNADGSPGVAATASISLLPGLAMSLALVMLAAGLVLAAGGVVLIVLGARRQGPINPVSTSTEQLSPFVASLSRATAERPVMLSARLQPDLSRWKWLVKWFLAIPHFVVLAFLWPLFALLTVVAGISILFTGVYPRSLFDVNLGILRWTWRVSYYASSGGLGTDAYPPFTLAAVPDYPATLDIAYPTNLSRGLVLVKWLLSVPHLIIVGLLVSSWWGWSWAARGDSGYQNSSGGGFLDWMVVIAAVILLFTGAYPKRLFDIIIGFNRWIYRVVAYAALMTDAYPPFRLDEGGAEIPAPPAPPTPPAPGTTPPPVHDALADDEQTGDRVPETAGSLR